MVGLLARVDPQMRLQVTLLVKGSLALLVGADVLLLAQVSLQVNLEPLQPTVGFAASLKGTHVLLDI